MKFYFLSARPCALKLGGAYFGLVNDFERFIDLSPKENIFVEFIPEGALPISFFITEEIRFTPPDFCEVYILPDAVAIYARDFYCADATLRPIKQESFDDALVTLFFQSALQISIQTETEFFVKCLPDRFIDCTLSRHGGLFFLERKDELLAFNQRGVCALHERVLEYSFDEKGLNATLPLCDSQKRYAKCRFEWTENGVQKTQFTILQATENRQDLRSSLIAYAFFESVLIGADFKQFLCEELREKSSDLTGFLGDFKQVLPTENERECLLIYQKNDRLFHGKRFVVEIENELITDLKG